MRSRPRRKALPERIRISLVDDPASSIPLSLPSRRMWPVGLVLGVMFAIFAAVAVTQVSSMRGHEVGTVFDLMVLLFQGFWVLGWSVGVLILLLLTVLFLFYEESARIAGGRLIHVPRLGPLKVFIEYDLAKVRNIRVEHAGGPDRGRIRFDYEGGHHTLGTDLPRADAERHVQAIESAITALGSGDRMSEGRDARSREPPGIDVMQWIGRRRAARGEGIARAPARRVDRGPVEPAPWTSTSGVALMAANLVPLAGVLLLRWDLAQVMTLFWAENGVIGVYNLLKLGVIARWGVLFLGPFFVGHYGGFMAAHFVFIYYLFVRGIEASAAEAPAFAALAHLFLPLWPALLVLVASHGVSFYTNFLGRREYLGRKASEQMGEPYKRVVILHVTIIFGGWLILLLRSPLPALVFLVVLKTVVDLVAHRREHRVK